MLMMRRGGCVVPRMGGGRLPCADDGGGWGRLRSAVTGLTQGNQAGGSDQRYASICKGRDKE